MTSRFQPDSEWLVPPGIPPAIAPIDQESSEVTERRFAVSLDFSANEAQNVEDAASDAVAFDLKSDHQLSEAVESPRNQAPDDSWKREVAARVSNYRTKRPREPRYPSLLLKFEDPTPPLVAADDDFFQIEDSPSAINMQSVALEIAEPTLLPPAPETMARVLEFPRSSLSIAPPPRLDELADPVPGLPRILDVPDIAPLPPALGGISIEPIAQPETGRRPGFEIPLQSAGLPRRLLALAADAVVVACAAALFGYVFFRIANVDPLKREFLPMLAVVTAIFWAVYQYALLTYSASTPGLALAGLRLSKFDGSSVPRKIRQWRALASILSGASLALGYAWCFLDEDRLCWHDRITRTYMAPPEIKPISD
jgi:uncharacterized RDD family membrane protein YckC